MTSRPLNPVLEESRNARQFVREMLTCWGLSYLSDDAELIIAELVGNAVRHGLRAAPQLRQPGAWPSALRLCLLRRVGEVMLAVTDPSDDIPAPKAPSDRRRERSRPADRRRAQLRLGLVADRRPRQGRLGRFAVLARLICT